MGNDINTSNIEDFTNDEIDLKDIFLSFLRNKKLITKVTAFSIFLGIIHAYTAKKVWQGEFQIVLSNNNTTSISSNPALGGLLDGIEGFDLGGKGDPLMTEVGILKSPLVLSKVFEYVKEKKSTKNLIFNEWKRNSLNVELEKNTTILKISYEDKEKELIIPVLNKISKSYQEYSGRERLRSIQVGKDFFEKQIALFKEKSITSLTKSQEFATEQNLAILQGDSEIDKEIVNSINVENIRVNSANRISNLKIQIEQIINLDDNDLEKIQYYGNSIPGLVDTGLPDELNQTETQLAFKRTNFKETDKSIRNLIKKRDTLGVILKNKAINYLEAEIKLEQAKLKSAERPKGVLTKYRQLIRNAAKDNATLDRLEDNYRGLLLNEARTPDPWELITSPTLSPNPIKPIKKIILLYYLILGLVTGAAISLIKEKRGDIIFTKSQLRSVAQFPILLELPSDENESLEESFEFLFESKLFNNTDHFAFIIIGDFNNSEKVNLKKVIEFKKDLFNIGLIDNTKDLKKYSKLILISSFGIVKKAEISNEIKKLSLLDKEIIGMIVLNSN